jgi:hypothetical protein
MMSPNVACVKRAFRRRVLNRQAIAAFASGEGQGLRKRRNASSLRHLGLAVSQARFFAAERSSDLIFISPSRCGDSSLPLAASLSQITISAASILAFA